jgi:hypothetical protein
MITCFLFSQLYFHPCWSDVDLEKKIEDDKKENSAEAVNESKKCLGEM